MGEIFAVQSGRRIQNEPTRATRNCRFIGLGVESVDDWSIRGPHRKPIERRLLTIQIPKKHFLISGRETSSEIGCERRFPRSAFGIGDEDGFHNLLFSPNQPYTLASASAARMHHKFTPCRP